MKVSVLVDGEPRPDMLFTGGERKKPATLPFFFSRAGEATAVQVPPDMVEDGVYLWRQRWKRELETGEVVYTKEEIRQLKALGYLH